jgi:hypothetical protein
VKEFVVKYRDGKSSAIKGRGKSVHVYTDGHRMRKVAVLPHETHGKVPGVRISETAMRPFVFADIQTTGADFFPVSTIPPYLLEVLGLSRRRYSTWPCPYEAR